MDGSLLGVRIARRSPLINDMLFVDDSLFFRLTTGSAINNLMNILSVYYAASGQEINFDKSAVCFSNTPQNVKTRLVI
ncbi:conserved hypothetical protein [Ricinus communis]|uniref:Reverse transcriptase domain-containing protein n=1 Tax=Ricinus communis TaxID=3988 RepID=B9RPY6_RICCO|nr:conserved hypothetical protein [Ricinus communis]